jgi:hypothetical protein
MASNTPCIIENCDQTCKPASRFNICVRCRGRIGYAILKGPGWTTDRKRKLTMYQDRFQYLGYRRER